jgi:hypothetical protein
VGKIDVFERTITLIDENGNAVIRQLEDFRKELGYQSRNDGV